jgi:NAD(P)-dependent dehydrogenase (short-subunit alcohol dehydrogenase family)
VPTGIGVMTETSSIQTNRVALITGGTRRIGRAISLALAGAGYRIVLHGLRDSEEARDLVGTISARRGKSWFVDGDLADPAAPETIVKRAAEQAGPLTLLVNNASIFEDDTVNELDRTRWDRHLAINLTAPVFLAQAFAAQAPAGMDASIVNVTDQRVRKLVPRHFSYTLTKSALSAATVMLAQGLAPHVRVNAVAPGPTLPSPRQDEAAFARQQEALPLGRGPRPEDIAAAVLFLAASPTITGETIAVDGGQHTAWKTPDAWGFDE